MPACLAPYQFCAELGIEVVAAFGRLDEGELRARGANLLPVDVALPIGDVDALHRHGVRPGDALMGIEVGELARQERTRRRERETQGQCQNGEATQH